MGSVLSEIWPELVGAAIVGFIGWLNHVWIKSALYRLRGRIQRGFAATRNWFKDLRWTRQSTVDSEITEALSTAKTEWESATAEMKSAAEREIEQARSAEAAARESGAKAVEEARAEGRAAVDRVRRDLAPKEPDEDDKRVEQELRQHEADLKAQWVISTYRSKEFTYILFNYNARTARYVRIVPPSAGFQVFDGPPWPQLEHHDSPEFTGRVTDATAWRSYRRHLTVQWIDDHGDEQSASIQVDREPVDLWSPF